MLNTVVEVLEVVVLGLAATLQTVLVARLLGVRLSLRNDAEKRRKLAEQHEKAKAERRMAGVIEGEDGNEDRL